MIICRVRDGNHAIIVDRSSNWGNPFIMNRESEREYVCEMFEKYAVWRLTIEPDWLEPLRGNNLACWCAPKRCHAETLMRLANDMRLTAVTPEEGVG